MSTEANKALVRRFYEEIDKGNLEAMDELVAEDYIDHNPLPFPGFAFGRDGLKQAFKVFWEATPGHHRIEDQIAEGDKVVTRLTSFGKHEGDLPGAPRTGNDMEMTSITIHRVANGKLVEKWSEKDMIRLLQQIGVMPFEQSKGPSGTSGDLEKAKCLWDEYKYRHEHIWKLIFQITAAVVITLVIPYIKADIARSLRGWIVLVPSVGILLTLFSILRLERELEVLETIRNKHRELQNRLFATKWNVSKSKFSRDVLAYLFLLAVVGLVDLMVILFVWNPS